MEYLAVPYKLIDQHRVILAADFTTGCFFLDKEDCNLIQTGNRGGLNGSTQHFPEVYSQESETPKFVEGVDLSAALLCSDPTGNSRSGLRRLVMRDHASFERGT